MTSLKQKSPIILKAQWPNITVEYAYLDSIGEFDFAMPKQAISVAFTPHERVTWSVDAASKQTTVLPAGSVFIYGSREFVWHKREKKSEYVTIYLEPQYLQQVAIENELPEEVNLIHRVIFPDPTIVQVAHLLKGEAQSGGTAGTLYVESLKNLLVVYLLRNYSKASNISKKLAATQGALDILKLKQIKDYIEEHLTDEITLEKMASIVHLSQFYFAHAFKNATGESPHKYLMQRRIERAKILLSTTKLTLTEIAYRIGISNQSHFTAQFRKTTGVTPKAFRTQFG